MGKNMGEVGLEVKVRNSIVEVGVYKLEKKSVLGISN